MMWWPLLWFTLNLKYILLVLIGALYFYWHWTRKDLYISSCKLEGPLSWPIIGNLPDVFKHRKCILNFANELTTKYAHPQKFWMGPFLAVYVANPDDLQIILNHENALDKTFIYQFGNDYVGRCLLTVEGNIWRMRRKLIKPTFNVEVLEKYIKKFDKLSEILVKELEKTSEKEINVFDFVARCTLDMISSTAFDTELHAQTTPIGDQMIQATHNIFNVLLKRAVRLWLYADVIFRKTKLYQSFMKSVSIFHNYTDMVFNRKLKEWQLKLNEFPEPSIHNSPKCYVDGLLYNYLTYNNNSKTENLTQEQVKREMDVMFAAGSDTTAHAVSFILLIIAMFPEHQKLVHKEISELLEKINANDEGCIEKLHLHELKYLDRVINECLRLYPPTPLIARELSGKNNP
uniref:CSON000639 protein n=1 Tax=Culicoides sonorensis TaxID=179676 RepID=A0A336LPX2_CULSO